MIGFVEYVTSRQNRLTSLVYLSSPFKSLVCLLLSVFVYPSLSLRLVPCMEWIQHGWSNVMDE